MKTDKGQAGFSLMEVNMAIFVMAVGILGLVALFPLGLRESTQGQADLKQSMFADYMLNQAVAAASRSDVTWTEWEGWAGSHRPREQSTVSLGNSVPPFIAKYLTTPDWANAPKKDQQYKIACCLVPGFSDRIIGIMVQSSDLVKSVSKYNQFSNNPVYYAEVMFQGDPTK